MRLQFNLLPDVKLEYLKTQRTKRTIIFASMLVSAFALFIFLFMVATVYLVNKNQLDDAEKEVEKYSNQLKKIPNLDKILTVQNQLKTLPSLHQSKHTFSRLYEFLPQLTPVNLSLGRLSIDVAESTMLIEGTADSQRTVNTFIDTLKFTTYAIDEDDTKQNAFTSVKETQFGLREGKASYSLTVKFDPVLFSNEKKVSLKVPAGLATTRSVLDNPVKDLFTGETDATLREKAGNSNAGGGSL